MAVFWVVAVTHKTAIFVLTAVRTSNPTKKVPAFHGTSEFITVFAKV
jgi:hypothetical protein